MAILAHSGGNGVAAGPDPATERDRIAAWLRLFVAPDLGCVELRALDVTRRGSRTTHTETAFYRFEDLDAMARDALQLDHRARGVYFTLNPVHPNAYLSPASKATADLDVLARRWLLIDCDPVRTADLSATDTEKAAAEAIARTVRDHLRSLGWPDPILADSGNGWHLLYRIDLPNDDASRDLIRGCLNTLKQQFSTSAVTIDTTVANASRICKLYGTTARKGSATEDRPHRPSQIVDIPSRLDPAIPELLEHLAASGRETNPAIGATGPALAAHGLVAHAGLSSDPHRAHALRALEDERDAVRSALIGNRNNQLFKSVVALYELVKAGTLTQAEVDSELVAAASIAGLEDSEILATLTSAFRKAKPRDLSHVGTRSTPGTNGHATSSVVPGEPEPWEPPLAEEIPPAVPFPLEVLPTELARFVAIASECLTCAPDFLGLALLTIAGAAVGRSVALAVKDSWVESAALYTAIVAPPGATKTPALALAVRPLFALAADLIREHAEEVARLHDDDPKATAPPLKRVIVSDATTEALAPILQDNPRGILMYRDELTAWVAGLNQYKTGGKGADRQFFLSAWSGAPVAIDRKSQDRGPIHIPHPFLAVLGGLTPEMLSELAEGKGRDDGFIDRMLFAYPDPVRVRWRPEGVPDVLAAGWAFAVHRLFRREPYFDPDERRVRPWFVRFTPAALDCYASWYDDHCREAEGSDFPPHLAGCWSKLRAYCARLALVLGCLRWACNPEATGAPDIDRLDTEGAVNLIDYFKAHNRRVRVLLRHGPDDSADALAILRWLRGSGRTEVSIREIRNNFQGRFAGDDPALETAIRWLENRHHIRPRIDPEPRGKRRGRPASPVYEINPMSLNPTPSDPEIPF